MLEFLRKIMIIDNAPHEITNFYGLSAPSPEVVRKREKQIKLITTRMGNKHRLAVSVRK